jgi:hypothetical protein
MYCKNVFIVKLFRTGNYDDDDEGATRVLNMHFCRRPFRHPSRPPNLESTCHVDIYGFICHLSFGWVWFEWDKFRQRFRR